MDRRQFIAASSVAIAASAAPAIAQQRQRPETRGQGRPGVRGQGRPGASRSRFRKEYYELRVYKLASAVQKKRLIGFMEKVAIPALNRLNIAPVGVFTVLDKPEDNNVYVLLPHRSMFSVVTATSKLLADEKYVADGAEFLNLSKNDSGYERIETSLLAAFDGMPRLEAVNKKPSRIFELRCYESHSVKKGQKKIEMFNTGGEIAIFREKGLPPVFFGEMLVGKNVPCLTYMIVFDDMETHDKGWAVFGSSPEWKKLRGDPQYADTVSKIYKTFLRPTESSQI